MDNSSDSQVSEASETTHSTDEANQTESQHSSDSGISGASDESGESIDSARTSIGEHLIADYLDEQDAPQILIDWMVDTEDYEKLKDLLREEKDRSDVDAFYKDCETRFARLQEKYQFDLKYEEEFLDRRDNLDWDGFPVRPPELQPDLAPEEYPPTHKRRFESPP